LQPLPMPEKQWQTVTMDHIVALPPTLDGNTSLVVFVKKLTKMIQIAPCVGQSDAPMLAYPFLENVFWYHGMHRGLSVIGILDSILNSGQSFLGIAK
jgi:cellobiose-specific phosphotransferase system component IIC